MQTIKSLLRAVSESAAVVETAARTANKSVSIAEIYVDQAIAEAKADIAQAAKSSAKNKAP